MTTIPLLMQPADPALTPADADDYTTDVYDVIVVDDDLNPLDRLDGAVVVEFGNEPLPAQTTATLIVPETSVGLDRFAATDGRPKVLYPFVEIRRRGVCRFRGFPHRWDVDTRSGLVRLTLMTLPALGSRVTVSAPERTNLLANGDFESGVTGWTPSGTATVSSTSWSREGTLGALVQGGADGGYISKTVTLTLGDNDQSIYVACWTYVPAGQSWGFGMVATRIIDGGPAEDDDHHGPLIDETKKGTTGEWVRLVTRPMSIDVSEVTSTAQVTVKLYAPPSGSVFFDGVEVVQAENESVPVGGDPAQFVAFLWRRGLNEKLDVPVTVVWDPVGEVLSDGARAYHYQFGEVAQLITQWPQVESRYDPRLNRIRCGPRIGTARTSLVMGDTWAGQVTEWAIDSSNVAKAVFTLGDDDGQPVTRPVGFYEEAGAQVPVEYVDTETPAGLGPKELTTRAETIQGQRADATLTLSGVLPVPHGRDTPADWLDENLDVGDSFPVGINDGPFDFAATARVKSWRVYPQKGDTMEVELVSDDV